MRVYSPRLQHTVIQPQPSLKVTCAVGEPSCLKLLRFMIGAGACVGSSPAARRVCSTFRISFRWPVSSGTVPTSSSFLDPHSVLHSTHCKPRVRISTCSRSQSRTACSPHTLRAFASARTLRTSAVSSIPVRTPRSFQRSKKERPNPNSVMSACDEGQGTHCISPVARQRERDDDCHVKLWRRGVPQAAFGSWSSPSPCGMPYAPRRQRDPKRGAPARSCGSTPPARTSPRRSAAYTRQSPAAAALAACAAARRYPGRSSCSASPIKLRVLVTTTITVTNLR